MNPGGKPNEGKTEDDPDRQVQALERRVEAIRGRLDGVVGELDQRWHHLWTLPPALRRYARPLLVTSAALALLAAGALAVRASRRRRRRSVGRWGRYRNVAAQLVRDPERLLRPPQPPQPSQPAFGSRILVAAASAAAAVVARHLMSAVLEASSPRRSTGRG